MLGQDMPPSNPPQSRGATELRNASDAHIDWLDGLRGFAALWVLLSHVQILVGMQPIPVLSWGGLAVDLFMMLSGFLMAHHYLQRANVEPWQQPSTALYFWVRRFFRIAPLYYSLLFAALLIGPYHGTIRLMLLVSLLVVAVWARHFQGESLARILMVIGMFYLMDASASLPLSGMLQRYLERLRSALASRSGKFLGETSYTVYLLHLTVVLPVAGLLARQAWYVREPPWIRFSVCALIVATIVYPISWLLYSIVERSGIQWGKRTVAAMRRRIPEHRGARHSH